MRELKIMNISSAISESLNNILTHPFVKKLDNGGCTLNDVRLFAEQYYLVSGAFVDFLLLGSTRIKEDENRNAFIENLFDEHGRGNPKVNHRKLLKRFLVAAGCKEIDEIVPLETTAAYIHGMRDLCSTGTQLEVLGALGPGCEGFTVEQYSVINDALERHFKFSKDDLIFFISHVAHDPKHTSDIDNVIEVLVKNESDFNQVISGAKKSIIFENIFWNGLYDATSS